MKDFKDYVLSPYWNPLTEKEDEGGDRQFRFDDPRKYAKAYFYQNGKVIDYEDTGISYAPFHEHKFSRDILRVQNDKVFFVPGIEDSLTFNNIVYQFVVNTKAMEEAKEEWYEQEIALINIFHADVADELGIDVSGSVFAALTEWVYQDSFWTWFESDEDTNSFETQYYAFQRGFDLIKKLPLI